MFRLQNNTPSYYVNNSRDFQLFCRLYDYINNGVKFDIDSIININDPLKINDRLLNLYGSKVGFFTNKNINTNEIIWETTPKREGNLKSSKITSFKSAPWSSIKIILFWPLLFVL